MIDAKELKVGNLVFVTGSGYSKGQEVRMRLIKRIDGLRTFENGDAFAYFGDDRVSCLNIRSVPVTSENILNCGFEEVGLSENVYRKDNLRIYLNKDDSTVLFKMNDSDIDVSSVHQLQNLYFALTGRELEWKA
jgi:hypothetical protein